MNRIMGGGEFRYAYDGLDVIMERNSSITMYRYFRGLGIDEPWLQNRAKSPSSTNSYVYLADALGSIVAMTDSNQSILTEYDYEPFGATTTTGSALTNSYKFTAREEDGTGLYYYRARYYHPALGRFASEDPLDMVDGPNVYTYAMNSPLDRRDPSGKLVNPLLLVGLLESAWAYTCRHYAIEKALETFPENDKKQHCFASCWFNRCMGLQPGVTFLGGIAHELRNPDYGVADALRDIRVNVRGIVNSYTFRSCKDACENCPGG